MISEQRIDTVRKMMQNGSNVKQLSIDLNIKESTAERYVRLAKENKDLDNEIRIPKVLLLDIETVMMKAFIWFLGEQRIPDDHVIEDWNIVAWAAKWLFECNTMYDIQTPEEAVNRDDKRLMIGIWNLLDEADIIIGHNGDRFDLRKLNARFIEHDFMPPMPYKTIDTLKVAKKHFSFSSYKLQFLAKKFGIQGKLHTGFDLWKQCLKGDKKALKKMSDYNIQDVLILEELYLKLRPWIKSHPSLSLYMDVNIPVCENCGSSNIEHRGDYYTTNVNKYKTFRCLDCKAIGRSRYPEKKNKEALVSIAK